MHTPRSGLMTPADKTKLAGIEALADVTDATNVDAAGAVMESDIKDQSFVNLLENGDFENWSLGAAEAPDKWAFTQGGAGGGIAQIADTKIKTYVARMTKSDSGYSNLNQNFDDYERYKGRTVTLGCWIKSANTTASVVTIRLNDGVTSTTSFYQNSGDWEWITATKTLDAAASRLYGRALMNNTADATADYVGMILVEGSVCPAFSPKPLSDYREGDWTPGVSFGGGVTGITYGIQLGYYTKIGRQVTVTGFIVLSSKGTSNGAAVITGLPFAPINNNAALSAASLRLSLISYANQYQGYGKINTTTIPLEEILENGTVSPILDTDFANNSQITVQLTYFT